VWFLQYLGVRQTHIDVKTLDCHSERSEESVFLAQGRGRSLALLGITN
jgi:hypothetical protein